MVNHVKENDKKQRIMDAMLVLIAQKGIQATPMSQVIRDSGVSAGAIYHHFKNKEDIVQQLFLSIKKQVIISSMVNVSDEIDYQQAFFKLWRNSYQHLLANPNHLYFIEQCGMSPIITDTTRTTAESYENPIKDFVTKGIQAGILKPMNMRLMFNLMYASIMNTAKLQLTGMTQITDDDCEQAILYTWNGIKK